MNKLFEEAILNLYKKGQDGIIPKWETFHFGRCVYINEDHIIHEVHLQNGQEEFAPIVYTTTFEIVNGEIIYLGEGDERYAQVEENFSLFTFNR